MFGLKSCFRISVKDVAVVVLALMVASGASVVEAQSARRTRRESNANRKARIARTIEETYNHRWEAAGGGGYVRFQSGAPQRNNEVTFWMSATRYFSFNPKLGVVGEVRGAYGNAKIGNNSFIDFNPQISEYPFMGGLTYRLIAKEKVAISAFGEGGAAIGKFDGGSKGFPSQYLGVWQSATRPVFSVGANFDYNFYPNLALRVSPYYVGTTFQYSPLQQPPLTPPPPHGSVQNELGFNIGLVYRFGKIK